MEKRKDVFRILHFFILFREKNGVLHELFCTTKANRRDSMNALRRGSLCSIQLDSSAIKTIYSIHKLQIREEAAS